MNTKQEIDQAQRFTLETFTELTMDGGGQSIGVIDAERPGRYMATFSQGWERSAQAFVDKYNAAAAANKLTPQGVVVEIGLGQDLQLHTRYVQD